MQAPVLWWNLAEGLASVNFHLSERWGGPLSQLQPLNVVTFVVVALLFVSPFLFPAIFGMIAPAAGQRHSPTAPASLASRRSRCHRWPCSTLSLFAEVFFYWNIVAFLLVMPLVGGWMRHRWVMVGALRLWVRVRGAVLSSTSPWRPSPI